MALKTLLGRLEHKLRGNLESFVLEDGSTHYFNPKGGELYLHASACIRADHGGRPRPEPPATLVALCKARDRRSAAEKVATAGLFPYNREALIERGVLEPRSVVAGGPSTQAKDLSEPSLVTRLTALDGPQTSAGPRSKGRMPP